MAFESPISSTSFFCFFGEVPRGGVRILRCEEGLLSAVFFPPPSFLWLPRRVPEQHGYSGDGPDAVTGLIGRWIEWHVVARGRCECLPVDR
ncbi:unnamed protein product [Sphagnum tenellum]